MKTARFWHVRPDGRIECELCPHGCVLTEGKTGLCRIRGVEGGELRAMGYGLISSANLDPIEKKPLYHFHPGALIFSVGGWGCNFACFFCQNWQISQQVLASGRTYAPEDVISMARTEGSFGIAYTYNEPLVGIEFVLDCVRLARKAGLANVLVTNGYVRPGPAAELLPLVDALNLDIKSLDDAFYRQRCRGTLQPVLDFARQAVAARCHVEITNLLIPGLNDADSSVAALAEWVAANLGENVPLHVSGYRPEYKSDIGPTPVSNLRHAYDICRRRLPYVYIGNAMADRGQDTECPQCGAVLIRRRGYATAVVGAEGQACRACGRPIDAVFAGKRR
jgi:pyruvate formate lyase activating enzyme